MLTVAVVSVAAGIALAAHNTRLHRDTLSHAHIVHTAAYGRDVAGKFMPDGHRKRSGRMQPSCDVQIAATDGAGTYSHKPVSYTHLHFSNQELEAQFKRGIDAMARLYGLNGGDEA